MKEVIRLTKWSIDASHTDVAFSVKHMGIMNVRGSFKEVVGDVSLTDAHELTGVNAKIQVDSIATRDKDRDAHLLGEDFFHAAKHPTITFTSTSVKKLDDHTYEVTGNLTLLGVTKQVTLETTVGKPISDPFGFNRIGVESKTKINRQDFGMKWNQALDTGGLLVGNDIKISIDSEIILPK